MAKYVLVDANSFVHRYYRGYQPKLNADGEDHRVLYGLMDLLVNLPEMIENIEYLYMIFDPEDGSLFRKSIFPAYKANRPPHEPDMLRQQKHAELFLKDTLGLPMLHYNGYEADDIIASYAHYLSKEGHEVVVVSPDKDLFQLVEKNVVMLRPVKRKDENGNSKKYYEWITEKGVMDVFGVTANKIPDLLALMGDVADNLPGVHKIGVKGAAKLLTEFPSLDHIIAMAPHMTDTRGVNIRAALPYLPIVKVLATVVRDLPIIERSEKSLRHAIDIQNADDYKDKIRKMQDYYIWPSYFTDLFLQDDVNEHKPSVSPPGI